MSRTLLLLAFAGALVTSTTGCTIVKPLVCAVTHPYQNLKKAVNSSDDDEEDHNDIPPAALIPTAIVAIPIVVVANSAVGIVGGLATGIVSDLNVVVDNADWKSLNLHRALKTNAKAPEDRE